MRRKILLIGFLAFLIGCGETAKVKNTNVTPEGWFEGIVRDALTGIPLNGVSVETFNGMEKVSGLTDSDGSYFLGPLPAGSVYTIRFSREEYVPRFFTSSLPNITAFPQGNARTELNVEMYPATGGVKGVVHYYPNGSTLPYPATGAVVSIDLRDFGFDFFAQVTAKDDGTYEINGLPADYDGFSVNINVYYSPPDENPVSGTFNVEVFAGATVEKDLDLYAPGWAPPPVVTNAVILGGESADNTGNPNSKTISLLVCYNMTMDTNVDPDFQNITSDVNVDNQYWISAECHIFELSIDPDTDGRGDYKIKNAKSSAGVKQVEYVGTLN